MKASEQLRGWAVDRAIELAKANSANEKIPKSVEEIIAHAKDLIAYCIDQETLEKFDATYEEKLATDEESVQ